MTQAGNDDINSAVEAATTKVKVDQLDRSLGHTISNMRVLTTFGSIVSIMVSLLLPVGLFLWNAVSGVAQSVAELKSEVTALQDALGETPDQLVRFLEDLEEVGRDLDRQVRQIESNQKGLFNAASTVESRTSLWQQYMSDMRDVKSDLEVLKRELLRPEEQAPDRMIQVPDTTR